MEHVKKREEISKEFTWALEDLYQDQAAWSEDLEKIRKLAQELYSCKGTLVEGAENLKKALNFYSELNQRFEKAYVYANQLLRNEPHLKYFPYENVFINDFFVYFSFPIFPLYKRDLLL